MSDIETTTPEPLYDAQTGEPIEPGTREVQNLREAASRGRKAQAEADSLKREMAFLKAGVDTDSKAGKLLLRAYDGDIADIAALKAEAESIGALTTAPEPVPVTVVDPNPVTEAESRLLAQRQQVASGAPASGLITEGKDPHAEATRVYEETVRKGLPKVQGQAEAFHVLTDAFLKGDRRAAWHDQGQGQMSDRYPDPNAP